MRFVTFTVFLFVLLVGGFGCTSDPVPAATVAAPAQRAERATPEGMTRANFTSYDGLTISYLNGSDGAAVVLLHGLAGEALDWTETALFRELTRQGYRVIIPDLRGSGRSDRPTTAAGYAAAETRDLSALLDHLGLDTVAAVGYARGAVVLADWLTREPRVERAVLGGVGLDAFNPESERRKAYQRAFSSNEAPSDDLPLLARARAVGADFPTLALQHQQTPIPDQAALERITVPIYVVAGKGDQESGNPGRLEKLFPNGKLSVIPGDHAETFSSVVFGAAVMAFLKQGKVSARQK